MPIIPEIARLEPGAGLMAMALGFTWLQAFKRSRRLDLFLGVLGVGESDRDGRGLIVIRHEDFKPFEGQVSLDLQLAAMWESLWYPVNMTTLTQEVALRGGFSTHPGPFTPAPRQLNLVQVDALVAGCVFAGAWIPNIS